MTYRYIVLPLVLMGFVLPLSASAAITVDMDLATQTATVRGLSARVAEGLGKGTHAANFGLISSIGTGMPVNSNLDTSAARDGVVKAKIHFYNANPNAVYREVTPGIYTVSLQLIEYSSASAKGFNELAKVSSASFAWPQGANITSLAAQPACILKTSSLQSRVGEKYTITWTSVNATKAAWLSTYGEAKTYKMGKKPKAEGSKTFTPKKPGTWPIALTVRGTSGSATCNTSFTILPRKWGQGTITHYGRAVTTTTPVISGTAQEREVRIRIKEAYGKDWIHTSPLIPVVNGAWQYVPITALAKTGDYTIALETAKGDALANDGLLVRAP